MKILVLFNAQSAVGFRAAASAIVKKQQEEYIPWAVAVGNELRRQQNPEGFVWTVGNFLVYHYLKQATPEQQGLMVNAIRDGIIRWQGMPFTAHAELYSPELFSYGLSLSHELDRKFSQTTIAAGLYDLPGMTRAAVPLLRREGIEFLHIVPPEACAVADVPPFFRWKDAESGQSVTVWYPTEKSEDIVWLPGTETGVCVASMGSYGIPQSADKVLKLFTRLHDAYPEALIEAGTLNDVALALRPVADTLPEVTAEIGDTWIQGVGSDPQKISCFRALCRLSGTFDNASREKLFDKLLLIPEYAWSLSSVGRLDERLDGQRAGFAAWRRTDAMAKKLEQSWAEQRQYLRDGVDAMLCRSRETAVQAMLDSAPVMPPICSMVRTEQRFFMIHQWRFHFGVHGIDLLENGNTVYADKTHPLAQFVYEVFSPKEVRDFEERFLRRKTPEDLAAFGRPERMTRPDSYHRFEATYHAVFQEGGTLYVQLTMEAEANADYGCPLELILKIVPQPDAVVFDFLWFDKPATLTPEALWLGFCFTKPLTGIRKLGSFVDPKEIVFGGNREMHATTGDLRFGNFAFATVDAPLVAVEKPNVYAYENRIPHTEKGAWINLYNNQWGTRYPLWNEGDARFRFLLQKSDEP